MTKYKNLSRHSGVSHYKTGADFIRLKFVGSATVYEYNHRITGVDEV